MLFGKGQPGATVIIIKLHSIHQRSVHVGSNSIIMLALDS
jgi:hypothetical protein